MSATWGARLGVNAPLRADVFPTLRAFGFGWARVALACDWGNVKSTATTLGKAASDNGIRLIVTLFRSSHSYPNTPAALTLWDQVARHVATTPGVAVVQVGNEWNLDWAWKGHDGTYRVQGIYTDRAISAVKQANPSMPVIGSGFAPYGQDDGWRLGRWPWLATDALIGQTVQDLDGYGYHPYGYDPSGALAPLDRYWPDHPGWGGTHGARRVWQVSKERGGAKPLYASELGAPSAIYPSPGHWAFHHACIATELRAQARDGVEWAALCLFAWEDGTGSDWHGTFGLVDRDGRPKQPTYDFWRGMCSTSWPG